MMILDHFPEESGSEMSLDFFLGGQMHVHLQTSLSKMRRETNIPKKED